MLQGFVDRCKGALGLSENHPHSQFLSYFYAVKSATNEVLSSPELGKSKVTPTELLTLKESLDSFQQSLDKFLDKLVIQEVDKAALIKAFKLFLTYILNKKGRLKMLISGLSGQRDCIVVITTKLKLVQMNMENQRTELSPAQTKINSTYSKFQYVTLTQAIEDNNLEAINVMLKVNPEQKLKTPDTKLSNLPIHTAVLMRNVMIVKILLEKGSPVHETNKFGQLPLELAMLHNNFPLVELLCQPTKDSISRLRIRLNLKYLMYSDFQIRTLLLQTFTEFINEPLPPSPGYRNASGQTLLSKLAFNGEAEIVEEIIKMGGIVDAKDNTGCTALHWAAAGGQAESVKILHENGADVNERNSSGNTPLILAAHSGSVSVIEQLVDLGADISATNNEKRSALHEAVVGFNLDKVAVIQTLLDKGANVNQKDGTGATPLFLSVVNPSVEVASVILAQPEVDVNSAPENCPSPIHFVVANADTVELIPKMSEKKADFNSVDQMGMTPIFKASKGAAKLLLETAKIDLNVQDNQGRTPTMYKLQKKEFDVAEAFIDNGAQVDIQDNNQLTVLMESIKQGKMEIAEKIIEQAKRPGGLKNQPNVASFINLKNKEQQTALHICCYSEVERAPETLEILARSGGDFSLQDFNENAPIHIAAQHKNKMTQICIKSAPESVNIQNKQKNTALHIAAALCNEYAVKACTDCNKTNYSLKNETGNTASQSSSDARVVKEIAHANMKTKGGKQGFLIIGLEWFNWNDLDLHLHCQHSHVYHSSRKCYTCNCELDVDMNISGSKVENFKNSKTPVEHIVFPSCPLDGKFTINVKQYSFHEVKEVENTKLNLFLLKEDELVFFCTGNISQSNQGEEILFFTFQVKGGEIIELEPSSVAEVVWDSLRNIKKQTRKDDSAIILDSVTATMGKTMIEDFSLDLSHYTQK